MYEKDGGALIARHGGETLRIEPWGENSLRVRATMRSTFTDYAWALTEPVTATNSTIEIFDAKDWKKSGAFHS